jgi:hypothetical protein
MFENYVSFWILQILFGVNLVVLYTAQLSSFCLCFIHLVGAGGQTDGYKNLVVRFSHADAHKMDFITTFSVVLY